MRALGRLGGSLALSPVQVAVRDKNQEVSGSAARVLADWPDSSALPALRDVAKNGAKQTQRVLALRGYVRLIGAGSNAPAEKLRDLRAGMALASRPEEMKLVLGGIGALSSINALQLAQSYLSDKNIAEEAAAAVLNIARNADADRLQNDADSEKTRAALRAVIALSNNENVRVQAQQILETPFYAARVWQVIGPFPNANGSENFDSEYSPENDARNGASIWKKITPSPV